jgi:predicted transglutaminase-like cysteine proteinase
VAQALLIQIIFTMILISVRPCLSRKLLFLILTAWICFCSASCFAASGYLKVTSTPYDRQMSRIRPVLFTKNNAGRQNLSLAVVNHWIQDLRSIPYRYSPEWKTPVEVQASPAADCKGKAVSLYQRMQAHGAENVRLVIGKRTWMSRKTHAWLEWTTDNGTFVLDPTINWSAYRSEGLGKWAYIPFYAYSGTDKYRSLENSLYARNEASWRLRKKRSIAVASVSPSEAR